MRLLKVRLRNINSLAGTWTVDFTDPELAESGLFLISGKTGSGKTTLLDAVSIALFARTTRLGKLSETNSEIMTRNTGECFAEVEFVSTRGWFRSTWTLKRAYKKPNGKVQQPSMRFEHREGENFVIEPLSLAETLRRVEEVTGLTYENFCRSMVLAQGQFDRFLHAKEADRSAILQDITGTDIYEKLSQRAFEHAKKARTAWDNAMDMLGRSAVLSGEELKQKQEELERLVQAQAARRADLVLRQAELAHAEKLAQAERARTAAVQEEVRCGKLVQDLAPDVEALAANERAARLDAPRAALAEAGQVLVRARAERLRLEASTPERERAAQTAIEQETQAQAALAGREAERAAAQPELVRARELDSRLAVSRKEFEDAGAQHEVLAARLTECEKEAAGTSRALAACAGSISKTDEELERTACDSALAGAFQALTLRHRDMLDRAGQADAAGRAERDAAKAFSDAARTRAMADSAVAAARTTLEETSGRSLRLAADREELLGGLTPAELSELRERTEAARLAVTEHAALARAQAELTGEARRRAETMRTLEQEVVRLGAEHEKLGRDAAGLSQIADLKRQIAERSRLVATMEEHRARLVDGQPCPCCGSLDHPWSRAPLPDADADERALEQAVREFETAQRAEADCGRRLAAVEASARAAMDELAQVRQKEAAGRDVCQAKRSALAGELALAVRAAGSAHRLSRAARALFEDCAAALAEADPSAEGQRALAGRLEALAPGLKEARDAQSACRRQAERLEADLARAEKEKAQAEKTLAQREGELAAAKEAEAAADKALLRTKADGAEARARAVTAVGAFADAVAPYGLSREQALARDVLNVLERRLGARGALEKQAADLREEKGRLETAAASLAERRKSLAEQAAGASEVLAARDRAYRELAAERERVLEGRDANRVEQGLAAAVEAAKTVLERARTARETAQRELAAHGTALESAAQALTRAAAREGDARDTALRLCREQDFPSLEEAAAARLSDARFMEFRTRVDDGTKALERAKAVRAEAERTLAALLAEPCGNRDIGQCRAACQALQDEADKLQKASGMLEEVLNRDRTLREERAALERDCEAKHAEHLRWASLDRLIGSADGKKFRSFAQGLTFARLLDQANRELSILSSRYVLVQCPDAPLEPMVVDTCMGGERRSIKNLSGGESFQVSLALALGLASFDRSSEPLETMFLDEGFGTLDPEALDRAVDTLSSLGTRKKAALIGVISHVEALEERIGTRIVLHRGGDGMSTLTGPGCSGRRTQQD